MKPASNSRGESANGNRGDAIKISLLEKGEPRIVPTLKSSGADSSRPTAGVPLNFDGKVVRLSERHAVVLAD
jgi:hypothetical protein